MRKVGGVVAVGMLSLSIGINARAADIDGILNCSCGDRLNILVKNKKAEWVSKDTDVVEIVSGKLYVVGKGTCVIQDKNSGYSISIVSEGLSDKASTMVTMNYGDVDKDVFVKDQTVKRVTRESKPEETEGTVVENTGEEKLIVDLVKPELNIYEYNGTLGESLDLSVSGVESVPVFKSSNEYVASVDSNGHVELVGEGTSVIYAMTEENILECALSVKLPTLDTSDMTLRRGEVGQIFVFDNNANLPVTYQVVDGFGRVDSNGVVSVDDGSYVVVRTFIGDSLWYDKKFISVSINEEYWLGMQSAIKECLGTPYVFGGVTPKVGLDCSAYVSYVYRSVGLVGSRYTAQGLYNISTPTEEPQPGDMVFFMGTYDAGEYITHIGIYAGNNEMYHSGNPNKKVSLDTDYWQSHLVGYGTLINENTPKLGK